MRLTERKSKVLIVEPEASTLDGLTGALSRRLDARLTCVSSAGACLDVDLTDPQDLVITEESLPDMSGLALAEKLRALAARPVILLTHNAGYDDAVAALRSGVSDIFCRPFSLEELMDSAARSLREQAVVRGRIARYHRMRRLVRHVIRERRDLRRRIELVCRDLVGAQKRLVHRVLAMGMRQPDSAA